MAYTHRWDEIRRENPDHSRRYAERWDRLVREGQDIDGEARLVDALVPRGARILDAGCGNGRVGGYLAARGHHVVGADLDPYLIDVARERHPGATWLVGDLAELDLPAVGEEPVDLVVSAGNVLTFVDPAARGVVAQNLARALVPGGRILTGFGAERGYGFAEHLADLERAGIVVEGRFATWELRPFAEDATFQVVLGHRAG